MPLQILVLVGQIWDISDCFGRFCRQDSSAKFSSTSMNLRTNLIGRNLPISMLVPYFDFGDRDVDDILPR